MCKHILINRFTLEDLPTLQDFASRSNEWDGFGAIMRKADGSIETLKSLCIASFYVELVKEAFTSEITTLVVHHRTSTNGEGIHYAHPFEFEGNFLTHNGVVRVPGDHDTKTTNDSEALLHHLIKSNFDTLSIEGYYSCFILNQTESIVLVDDLAPIYSDGRIYSSHKLDASFEKIESRKITLSVAGEVLDNVPIEVAKSTYGSNLAHLSLGASTVPPEGAEDFYPSPNVTHFMDMLSHEEEDSLFAARSEAHRRDVIREITQTLGLTLTAEDVAYISDFFADYGMEVV